MRWYLNDVSLQGQFENNIEDFFEILFELNSVKDRNEIFRNNFHIVSSFGLSNVTPNENVYSFLDKTTKFRDEKILAYKVIFDSTPFDDFDPNIINKSEKIVFEDKDVKETAIGIVTENKILEIDSSLFSFTGSLSQFKDAKLLVNYIDKNHKIEKYYITNFWKIIDLEKNVRECKPKKSWSDFFIILKEEFPYLEFRDDIFKNMEKKYPFDKFWYDEIYDRLYVLNQFMHNKNIDVDRNSDEYKNILNQIVNNKENKFSHEGRMNEKIFNEKLYFVNINGVRIYAPWRAKIRRNKLRVRIHFEWEVENDKKKMEIFYIGRKITEKQ